MTRSSPKISRNQPRTVGEENGILNSEYLVERAKVPGRWLVLSQFLVGGAHGLVLLPDPKHEWDGGSLLRLLVSQRRRDRHTRGAAGGDVARPQRQRGEAGSHRREHPPIRPVDQGHFARERSTQCDGNAKADDQAGSENGPSVNS